MIGTEANAAIAATLLSSDLPNGWTLIGKGCYRTVFLAPDGFAYKVCHDTEDDAFTENEEEYYNFVLRADDVIRLSNGKARLAPSFYYSDFDIIAMEFVPMSRPAMVHPKDNRFGMDFVDNETDILCLAFTNNELFDLSPRNLWYDANGILTMIDYV